MAPVDTPLQVPLIDLSELDGPKHDLVVEALVKAAETCGFFQVVNHGFSLEFLEELKGSVHSFHSQSEEKKAVYLTETSPSPLVMYAPSSNANTGTRDVLGMRYTNEQDASMYWPNSCKEVALKYVETSSKLLKTILRILMSNIGVTLDESIFDAYMGEKYLIMNYYPTGQDQTVSNKGYSTKHIDFSTLTVLLQDHIGGLFGKLNEDGDKEEWVEIKPIPGALLILVGQCLQILSNGKYKGGDHYAQPPTGAEIRVSFPIFMFPRFTRKTQPLPDQEVDINRMEEFVFGKYSEYVYSLKFVNARALALL